MAKPATFLKTIIRPTLKHMGLHSLAAEQLLLGTAIQESHLKYRRQIGGPALGYFQMEPNTHDDIWNNFLRYKPALSKVILQLIPKNANKYIELEINDKYAAAMARVHYFRVPAKLPVYNDIPKMAAYWKRYYNTPLGRGKVKEFINNWNKYGVSLP